MPIRPQLVCSLILVACLAGCGSEHDVVNSPVPEAPAVDVAPAVDPAAEMVQDIGEAPPAEDPFLSTDAPEQEKTGAETPEFEDAPSEGPSFDQANDAGQNDTAALDENDDSIAAETPDLDTLTAVVDDETATTDSGEPRYTRRKNHHPDGIGKFYMGREIAQVMGYLGAPWLERNTREEEERLTLLIKSLDLEPGQVVADIGAGSGVITLLMAPLVEPDGQIIAVDVQQKMLDLLKQKLAKFGVDNVKLVKGTPKSPRLDPESIDLAIMVDVYHEFEFPYEMLLELSQALKPGGAIAFVEYRLEDPTVPIKLLHKMSVEQVKKEAGLPEFGLEYRETIDVLPRQHIIIFEKSPGSRDESPEPE